MLFSAEAQKRSAERLTICNACEMFDKEKAKCNKCGCYMNIKTLLPKSKCPLNKWV